MKNFRVLIVDDKEFHQPSIEPQLSDVREKAGWPFLPHCTVAGDPESAIKAINTGYFHAAFVDLELTPKKDGDPEDKWINQGVNVLNSLREVRPSCRRYLWSVHPEIFIRRTNLLLNPINPLIHGAVDKEESLVDYIHALGLLWLRGEVEISSEDLRIVHSALLEKMRGRREVDTTIHEIYSTLSVLFGQSSRSAESNNSTDEEAVTRVEVAPLQNVDGMSQAVVFQAVPHAVSGRAGNTCVVKLGPIDLIEEEANRFERYAKYMWHYSNRVEIMGTVLADNIGAICYAFAGGAKGSVFELTKLLTERATDSASILSQLFSPAVGNDWYSATASEFEMMKYFSKEYGGSNVRWDDKIRSIRAFLNKLISANDEYAELIKQKSQTKYHVEFDNVNFDFELEDSLLSDIRGGYLSCLVHGDLHSSNVLIADNATVLIDFRRSGRGPAAIDFVSIDSSIRLFCCDEINIKDILKRYAVERRAWKLAWSTRPANAISCAYWEQLSTKVIRDFQTNFAEPNDKDSRLLPLEIQYAQAALFRMIPFVASSAISDRSQRLRYIIWIAMLANVVRTYYDSR